MIPINELRIGNYVDLYGTIAKIQRADFKGEGIAIDKGEPIPLDENCLLRSGFERKTRISNSGASGKPVWVLYSFSLTIWDDGRLFYDWIGGNVEIKHVHRLQNIYSDLLRKELIIKDR